MCALWMTLNDKAICGDKLGSKCIKATEFLSIGKVRWMVESKKF